MSEEDELEYNWENDDVVDFELLEARNMLYNEKNTILQTLRVIQRQNGIITEKQEHNIIQNLVELQDLIDNLSKDTEGYYGNDVETLLEFLKLGNEILEKYPNLKFADILRRTLLKITNYLEVIKYDFPKFKPETIKMPDVSRTSRKQFISSGSLTGEELRKLSKEEKENVIFVDIANEIHGKETASLSQEALKYVGNILVDAYWSRKARVEKLAKSLKS